MFDSVQKAINAFTSKPLPFAIVAGIHLLMQVLAFLAVLGIFVIFFFIASILHISVQSPPMLAIGGILLILLLYSFSGIKGAALNSYYQVLNGGKVTFIGFYNYALRKSPEFFKLFMVRTIVELIPASLIGALYFYVVKAWNLPYVDWFFAIVSIFFTFIIHYLFYGSFISAAIYDSDTRTSLKNSFKFVKTAHIFALVFYTIYAIVWFTQFVPIINIITLFVTFPIAYTAMIIYMQKSIDRRATATAVVQPVHEPNYRKKNRGKHKDTVQTAPDSDEEAEEEKEEN